MLVDTSGLLCYFDSSDVRHDDAVTFFETASHRVTHSYVLAEFIPLCQVRRLPRLSTILFVRSLMDNPRVSIVWVTKELHEVAVLYLQTRLDKTYSLCDAISFILMQQGGYTEALTSDRHFEQAGFRRLLSV